MFSQIHIKQVLFLGPRQRLIQRSLDKLGFIVFNEEQIAPSDVSCSMRDEMPPWILQISWPNTYKQTIFVQFTKAWTIYSWVSEHALFVCKSPNVNTNWYLHQSCSFYATRRRKMVGNSSAKFPGTQQCLKRTKYQQIVLECWQIFFSFNKYTVKSQNFPTGFSFVCRTMVFLLLPIKYILKLWAVA